MKSEKLKIIIVDDNQSFRTAAKLFLSNELSLMVVAEATNGKDFLTTINSINADLILMDIQMPELDGINAAKKLNSQNSDLKIIAITMLSYKDYLNQLKESGFKGYVNKNDFFHEIGTAIQKVISGGLYFKKLSQIEKK